MNGNGDKERPGPVKREAARADLVEFDEDASVADLVEGHVKISAARDGKGSLARVRKAAVGGGLYINENGAGAADHVPVSYMEAGEEPILLRDDTEVVTIEEKASYETCVK